MIGIRGLVEWHASVLHMERGQLVNDPAGWKLSLFGDFAWIIHFGAEYRKRYGSAWAAAIGKRNARTIWTR